VAVNFALIPFIGVIGAALAQALGWLIAFLYRYFDTKKLLHFHVAWNRFILVHVVLLIQGILMVKFNRIVLVGLEAVVFLATILIYKDLFMNLISMVKKRKGAN
jgi:O-antigen/teichoic acid export membrane protein